jgi:hypothetical protein
MWTIKEFKTKQAMNKFILSHAKKIQWVEVFVNNKWAIEYRPLIIIK